MIRLTRALAERVRQPKWLALVVVVTLVMFGLLVWQAITAYRVSHTLQNEFARGEQFKDRLVTLQQEQMLSVAMLVATGGAQWEQKYEELDRNLYATIQIVIQEQPPGFDPETLERLRDAHERLRERAIRAIELARVERAREGLGMLSSPRFQRAREQFGKEVDTFIDGYRKFLAARLLDERNRAFAALGVGFFIFLISIGVWVVLLRNQERDRSELEREIAERKHAEEGLRQLAGHLQSAGEQERNAIAGELHDEMRQSLAAIKIDLVRLRKRLPKQGQELQALLNNTLHTVNETITSIQRIFSELRPSILDHLGLLAAIEWQVNEFQERTGIECVLSLTSEEPDLPQEQKTALFRIVQESLSNVFRHAGATRVRIELSERDTWHQLAISDNGIGISDLDLENPNCYGLSGMRERAYIFGGQFEVRGQRGTGTTLRVRFPIRTSSDK